ncbi:carboxymuconolactone decarboxylase family protein [Streptomyces phaeolivaceus]|uniref:Carboxymuconolactone decarboxylase family protein n=1 Tax=Streptomyces phaeolivaceus TaxID=2653200 RepID=A0A5P8KEN8_9ACTN|nr:carboxymuconolactone decarboxylase family protein [Streptomyces phaeolivaceus]QFR01612.1 carboxymuconolactone decarboxylase family protein [Streptomyces phaeolivaceus]
MTVRLAGLLPGELDEQQAEVYRAITGGRRSAGPQSFALADEDGRLRGPFNAMLLSPPVGLAVQAVGSAVRYDSALTDRVREMAILAVAAHWGSAFEREAHEAVGRGCGLSERDMAALRAGSVPESADPAERTALRITHALLRAGELTGEEYDEAVLAVGARGVFELTTLVGYYGMLALQLRVFAGEKPAAGQATALPQPQTPS